MSERAKASSSQAVRWTWVGPGEAKQGSGKLFYKRAICSRGKNLPALLFAVGDSISIKGPGNSIWAAQVIEFCTTDHPEAEDEDDASNMRMTLRWIYSAKDIGTEAFKKCKGIPRTVARELYFSNHVGTSGSNSVDEIQGRAFLFSTKEEMNTFQREHRTMTGDALRTVRCCFDCLTSANKRLRELDVGELERLLDNPDMDPNEPRAIDDWSWVGRGEKEEHGDRVFYKAAKLHRDDGREPREFKVGDIVTTPGNDNAVWCAQIIEMFLRGYSDKNGHWSHKLVTLRWLYEPGHVDAEAFAQARAKNDIPEPVEHELYYSNHVDKFQTTLIEVVVGRAYLCPSEERKAALEAVNPQDFEEGDIIRLVRGFYANNWLRPGFRLLDQGELQRLMDEPSLDNHLYDGRTQCQVGRFKVPRKALPRKRGRSKK